jgi:dTMP kinase
MLSESKRGRFITLEGGEGAGKSTQIRLLAEALRARGLEVVTTREPGGSPGAEAVRGLLVSGETGRWEPMTEALLHFAARRDHLVRTVWPALERGAWVVCDRFADSTMAYQGYGLGLGRAPIERLYSLAIGAFAPDLTLILDLAPEIGVDRARARQLQMGDAEDRYERMDISFHRRLRDGFLDIARREPARCAVIDANQTIEGVQVSVYEVVSRRLSLATV